MQRYNMRLLYTWFIAIGLMILGSRAAAQTVEILDPGDAVLDTLSDSAAQYSFEGQAGDLVTITLASRAFDALLILETADGEEVARSDDSEGSLDSAISGQILPQDGDYRVIVGSSDGEGSGGYRLQLLYAPVQTLRFGDSVESELTETQLEVIYSFVGQEGDTPLIGMRSSAFDAHLTLSDATGAELIWDDDSGGGRNALIVGYVLPADGSYFVRARSLSQTATGPFSLQFDDFELSYIAYGDTIEGQIDGEALIYGFEGNYGDKIKVSFESEGQMDTVLSIKSPAGFVSAWDDDSGAGLDPEIMNVFLDADGLFVLSVLPVLPDTSGSFGFTLTAEPPRRIVEDQTETIRFSQKVQQLAFVFDAQAGETVRLIFSGDNANTSNLNVNIVQQGQVISNSFGDPAQSSFSAEAVIPEDGEVIVMVSDYNYRVLAYEMTLERSQS